MKIKDRHRRALVALAIAQVACLACGLWMHDRLMLATASKAAPAKSAAAAMAAGAAPAIAPSTHHVSLLRIMAIVWIGGLQITVSFLVLSRMQLESSRTEQRSQAQLLTRDQDLVRTRNAIVFGLAKLAEYRDQETGLHLERIALYSTRLAVALRRDPRYRDQITPTFIRTIGISSVLHDIGKVAIRDAVLRKPGKFEAEDRAHMNRHTTIGGDCIRQIEVRLGESNFLQMAREIALYHHESWDGSGYPNGLRGEQIPLAARLVALADIYDALSVKRVYKDAYPHEKCVELIRNESGLRLDPGIVEVFLGIADEFAEIAGRFRDAEMAAIAEARANSRKGPSQGDRNELLLSRVLGLEEICAEGAEAAG